MSDQNEGRWRSLPRSGFSAASDLIISQAKGVDPGEASFVPRKTALWSVMLCAALVSGCAYRGVSSTAADPPTATPAATPTATQADTPTAAQTDTLIQERGRVAQQHWAVAQAFRRAPLGFGLRLEVAVGFFTACSPGKAGVQGGSGGEQYQIVASWEPVGVPAAQQGGRLQLAVPVVERALNQAGWSPFQPSASSGLDVVATRQGVTLSLDADPANPGPDERDWIPAESYTVAGLCIPEPALAASEFESVGKEPYGTKPTALPPIGIPTA